LSPVIEPLDRLAGVLAGRYTLERELGRGGMGVVVLARDVGLDRQVAIKVLLPEDENWSRSRDRFLLETRTTAAFSHPNIVPVFAVEEHDEFLCFVMSYIEGETLASRVERMGPLGTSEAARLMREAGWALGYAHSRGVVHRDVKPENILLERATGRALIADFGIARSSASADLALTAGGSVLGSPLYMSPEQASGDSVDGRTDLYSLGATIIYALTGRPPFEAATARGLLAKQLTEPAPRIQSLRPDVPDALAAIVDRCLAKEPTQRFPSGEALVEAVEAAGAARPQVPPSVRVFWADAENVIYFVPFCAFLLVMPLIARDTFAALWGGAVALGVVTMAKAAHSLRRLGSEGFSFTELRAGLEGILRERADLAATPTSSHPRRRRIPWAWSCWGAGLLLIVAAMTLRLPDPVVLTLQLCSLLLILVGATMVALNPGRQQKLLSRRIRLWTGPVGRLLFRWANRNSKAH
jgi:eukaryotic-like serine/threonine-protein kinase